MLIAVGLAFVIQRRTDRLASFASALVLIVPPAVVPTISVLQKMGLYKTLSGFMSQFTNQWNLRFADVLVITIPPLLMFTFFQRQLVSGLTSGSVKG